MNTERSWLCPAPLDRQRVLEMESLARPARHAGVALVAIASVACVPVIGIVAPIAVAFVACAYWVVDAVTHRVARPEYAVLAGVLLPVIAIAVTIALSGGPASPVMPLMVLPVIGSTAVLPARGAALTLVAGSMALIAATVGVDPRGFADDPAPTSITLATLISGGLLARSLMQAEIRHRSTAILDPLTGLLNRASLPDRFAEIREQAIQNGGPVAVVLCDLDRFKDVNDTHGHQVGDAVLQNVAYEMRRALRTFELMYRLGGEEFLVLLPGADLDHATEVAERLRAAIARRPVAGVEVTVSFGVSAASAGEVHLDRLVDHADRALLAAKRAGRDRVAVSGTGPGAPALAPA